MPGVFGLSVNAVCPSITLTGMVRGIDEGWKAAGLPVTGPGDVAGVVVGLVSGSEVIGEGNLKRTEGEVASGRNLEGRFDTSAYVWGESKSVGGVNETAVYVEGEQGCDIEEGLAYAYTQPYWLGKGPTERLVQGQKVLGSGGDWTK